MAAIESSSSASAAPPHACRHAPAAPAPEGLAAHAWMGASAAGRLLLVAVLAGLGAVLVGWATAI